ncbi:MAG: hypothetical protein B6I29_01855 [Marinitoga sp. 4572_148]|nr:MAG: hypothetical protein B6I29_01855 [Marinitoga sp. 4572_148]
MKVGVVIIKVAILSTGEEIIEGDILNTTSREISRELYNMGFEISSHINVGDKRYDIITYLNILSRNNDIIFITGGLGSTRDDLTRESVAEFLKEDLIFDEHLFNKIIYRYKKYGKSSSELLKKQAFVFKDSIILENEIGSAPGIYIIRDMKHYFLLPGPPDEAISIFLKHIKPILSNFDTQKIKVKKIQFYNITESKLMAELNERLSNIKYSTKLELSIGPSIIFKDDFNG